jgi:thiamine biosynthesis lipoprotein
VPSKPSKTKPKPKAAGSAVLDFEAIGTVWQIELYCHSSVPNGLVPAITTAITAFDRNYSRFRDDSLVTAMSRKSGRYTLPADAQPLFDLYYSLYRLTDGKVTPLIGQTLADAGYDAAYSFTPGELHRPPAWETALDYHFPELTLHQPTLLDVGGAGKGYLVDIMGELLEAWGIADYCVDAGGDMRHRRLQGGQIPVGLEHPAAQTEVVGVAHLGNQSLCGSAGNRRTWLDANGGQIHHIIDPQLLASPTRVQAVWVTASSTLLADGLTTALFFAEPAHLRKHFDFAYAIITDDGQLQASADFPATFF